MVLIQAMHGDRVSRIESIARYTIFRNTLLPQDLRCSMVGKGKIRPVNAQLVAIST